MFRKILWKERIKMKRRFVLTFSVVLFLGIIFPIFGQEIDFVYLDHLLVYRTGKYFHVNRWHRDGYAGPFTDKNGRIYAYGIGMYADGGGNSGGVGYAEYQINGAYSLFEATLALAKEDLNDRGSTRFIIYADGIEIYNSRFISSSEPQNISVAIPSGTILLRFEVEQLRGQGGIHLPIWGLAILKK